MSFFARLSIVKICSPGVFVGAVAVLVEYSGIVAAKCIVILTRLSIVVGNALVIRSWSSP